jgi:hypothetical protein
MASEVLAGANVVTVFLDMMLCGLKLQTFQGGTSHMHVLPWRWRQQVPCYQVTRLQVWKQLIFQYSVYLSKHKQIYCLPVCSVLWRCLGGNRDLRSADTFANDRASQRCSYTGSADHSMYYIRSLCRKLNRLGLLQIFAKSCQFIMDLWIVIDFIKSSANARVNTHQQIRLCFVQSAVFVMEHKTVCSLQSHRRGEGVPPYNSEFLKSRLPSYIKFIS